MLKSEEKREHEAREDAEKGSKKPQLDSASQAADAFAQQKGLWEASKDKPQRENPRNRDTWGKYHLIPSDSIPSPNFYQTSPTCN